MGAGRGDFVDFFFGCVRPCDHAATISSSIVLKVPQIQFIDSGWIFLLCVQKQVPTVQTVQMTVEILQVPLLVHARYFATPGAQFVVSRSSTALSWRRCSFPWSYCSGNHRYSPVAVH